MSSGSIYASLTIVNLKVLSDITVDSWHDDSTCMKLLLGGGEDQDSSLQERGFTHIYT